ncbi:hypothetical protein GC170_05020 [bacterium]|nr:hypothetical protein [bacterium]
MRLGFGSSVLRSTLSIRLLALGLSLTMATSLAAQEESKAPGRSASTQWFAGAASVEITPPADAKAWLAGYAARKEPSTGVEQKIYAKALVITQPKGEALALVTLDLIGVRRPITRRVADRIETRYGIPRKGLVLFTSHTHCGPIPNDSPEKWEIYGIDASTVTPNVEFTTELENKIVEAVGKAMAARKAVRIEHGEGKAGFAVNRRESTGNGFKIGVNPQGPTDHSVPVLKVTDQRTNKPVAVMFGYACHNTTLGAEQLKICGDYAGYAQAAIEKANPGAVALFVTGCAGDQNPEPRGTLELAQKHGDTLATAVNDALSGKLSPVSGSLKSVHAEPILHFAGPVDRYSYQSRLTEKGGPRDAHARRLINILAAGNVIDRNQPYPIQVISFGDDLLMVALAGEVVVDYSINLKARHAKPNRPLWVAAYANDVFGYIPSTRVLREGGYEGGEAYYYSNFPTPLASDTERIITEEVRRLIDELASPNSAPVPVATTPTLASPTSPNSARLIDPDAPPPPPAANEVPKPEAAPANPEAAPTTPAPAAPAAVPAPTP